jgi:hypothetical protein
MPDASDGGPEAREFLPELAGLLLDEHTISGLLDLVVNLAASAIEGVAGASVSLLSRDGERLETTNASSSTVRSADAVQYQFRQGPCVETIRTGEEVRASLPDGRWPEFSEQALETGLRSIWSLPLRVGTLVTGALNLYSTDDPSWMVGAATRAARGLASQAAVVLANAASLASAQMTNRHLQEALESRDLIGQAKGILMAREGVDAEGAFGILRRESQRSGRKLRDIAAEVVERHRGSRSGS